MLRVRPDGEALVVPVAAGVVEGDRPAVGVGEGFSGAGHDVVADDLDGGGGGAEEVG